MSKFKLSIFTAATLIITFIGLGMLFINRKQIIRDNNEYKQQFITKLQKGEEVTYNYQAYDEKGNRKKVLETQRNYNQPRTLKALRSRIPEYAKLFELKCIHDVINTKRKQLTDPKLPELEMIQTYFQLELFLTYATLLENNEVILIENGRSFPKIPGTFVFRHDTFDLFADKKGNILGDEIVPLDADARRLWYQANSRDLSIIRKSLVYVIDLNKFPLLAQLYQDIITTKQHNIEEYIMEFNRLPTEVRAHLIKESDEAKKILRKGNPNPEQETNLLKKVLRFPTKNNLAIRPRKARI